MHRQPLGLKDQGNLPGARHPRLGQEGRIEQVWSPVKPEDTVPNALAAAAA